MKREGTLLDISDGKLYDSNHMAKIGCEDCRGCSACCKGMGESLVLDPYDIYQMTNGLGITFVELLQDKIELNMVDGVILPNMAMKGNQEACGFLDENGRCSIHDVRPGICRLFPLGRYYENGDFRYFVQKDQCKKESRSKVKIKSFLGIENLKAYEAYIKDWHNFLKKKEKEIKESLHAGEDEKVKKLTMEVLQCFYMTPYTKEDFYQQYYDRRRL